MLYERFFHLPQVDDLDFASLGPMGEGSDALKGIDAGGVTDDEFNALFGE